MAKETKITIEVSDIKAIEIECEREDCHARYVRPVGRWQSDLISCSVCNQPLMTLNSDDSQRLTYLAGAVASLTRSAGSNRPYKIRLVVAGLEEN